MCKFVSRQRILAANLAILLISGFATPYGLCENKATDMLASDTPTVSREDMPNGHKCVKATILIHASPQIVWETVHKERQKDADLAYAHVHEQGPNQMTLEEKFVFLPYIGTATCLMKHTEVPMQRIDFYLIKSDLFKSMEGSWVLTSNDNGKSTILALSSYLELVFPVPRPY